MVTGIADSEDTFITEWESLKFRNDFSNDFQWNYKGLFDLKMMRFTRRHVLVPVFFICAFFDN